MKNSLYFKNAAFRATLAFCLGMGWLLGLPMVSFGQLSTGYTFSHHTSPPYAVVTGGTELAIGTGAAMNDAVYPNQPIGFIFNFNGIDYTTFGVSTNGFIWFGNTNPAITEYTPISSTTAMSGVIAAFAANLKGRTAAASLRYRLSTTCPRTLTIQWNHMVVEGVAFSTALDAFGFFNNRQDMQITLTEGSNAIDIMVHNAPYLLNAFYQGQLGLRGASNSDFANRRVTSEDNEWASSAPGTTNAARVDMDGIDFPTFPAQDTRYRYTPTAVSTPLTWTGTTSTDWFTASNWSPARVPNTYNDVNIPSGSPTISGAANASCRSLTIAAGASLSTTAAYTGLFVMSGSLTNNGTITTASTEDMAMFAATTATIGGSGNFNAANITIAGGSCGVVSLANTIVLRRLQILNGSTLNMSGFNLTALTRFNQIGTINQSSGTLQIEDVLPTLTNATFNENTGTTFFATGTTTPASTQNIPHISYNHLRIRFNFGFFAIIGNAALTTPMSCNNLEIFNPGQAGTSTGGRVFLNSELNVNGNLNLGPTGNSFVFTLAKNLTIAGVLNLNTGIINTAANQVTVSNGTAAAIVAGSANPNYSLSYINGNLRRTISMAVSGDYDFPVGFEFIPRFLQMNNNVLSGGGFNSLTARFAPLTGHTDAAMTATEPLEAGIVYNSLATEGVWFLTPNSQPTSGSYNLNAYINGFAGLVDNQFGLLKRPDASTSGADWTNGGIVASRPAPNQPGRTLSSGFARRQFLSTFSQFGIGKSAMAATTNLGIIKTANNMNPTIGTNMVFNLRAFNAGASAATNVIVRDTLPAGYTFVSSNPPTVYNLATHTWTIGNLANGDTARLSITALVNATGSYANTAIVSGTETDPTPANNRSTATPVPQLPLPVANNDTVYTFINVPVSADVRTNDVLPAGGTYTFSVVSQAPVSQGTAVLNANGSFTFTPAAGFLGNAMFSYRVCNQNNRCDTANVVVVVGLPALIARPDTVYTTAPIAVSGDVKPNDILPTGGVYTFVLATPSAAGQGSAVINSTNGTYIFTPAAGFVGTAFFVYRVCNQFNECSNSRVTIIVAPPLPIAKNDTVYTGASQPVTADVRPNDILIAGGIYTFSMLTPPPATQGTVIFNANGTFTFTPAAGFVGNATFVYSVCNQNNQCATANVLVVVSPSVPTAKNDSISTIMDKPISASVASNDILPAGATYTFSLVTPPAASGGTVVFNPDGSYTFTPAMGFVGNVVFGYKVCNQNNQCSNATVTIKVLPPPIALKIPQGFSPNNDGTNDNFVISGLNNRIMKFKVYNRWGNLVYESDDYKNDWNGSANQGVRVGEQLPDGTYFYVAEFVDNNERYNSYITLKR